MINIRCKKCGWKLPFSAKGPKDSVVHRGESNVKCPKCGELLIQKGGKKNRWYYFHYFYKLTFIIEICKTI